MNLSINKRKFEVFLEVSRLLNTYGIIPILYGSLGLWKIIGEFDKANDIDILVPKKFIKEKWNFLINLVGKINFELKDEHEHEFTRDSEIIAFARQEDLEERLQINPKKIKISKINDIRFKELSPKQYLGVYQFMLRDKYRQEKLGKGDQKKINLIKKYLENRKNNQK